jgi:hypothetical protein
MGSRSKTKSKKKSKNIPTVEITPESHETIVHFTDVPEAVEFNWYPYVRINHVVRRVQ